MMLEEVVTRVEKGMLRWFDHLERMNESRLTKQIYKTNVCDERSARVGLGRSLSTLENRMTAGVATRHHALVTLSLLPTGLGYLPLSLG
ncbi:hypothetical protein EVAR_46182_1 [Eumeta japonica]|uniref:Uncharacterized protein n=1 Tax=Eumeta variegata TaxID=151549 RepID=A0A4C1Y387_EUMVA|nr:hypothetical protein EVAR_46182_1 [Eumeta japonica]